jgi:hypothetical protein
VGREVVTGIVYEGVDRGATDTSKAVANEAEGLKSRLDGMSDTVNALPDQLGKSATALMIFQNSTSQMSGEVADAANKITALGALVMSGGPVGIAIAAATIALIGLSKAFEVVTAHTAAFNTALKSLQPVFASMDERINSSADNIKDLKKELEDFGKSSVRILKEQIAFDKAGLESNKQMIEQDRERIRILTGLRTLTADMGDEERERVLEQHGLAGKTQEDLAEEAIWIGRQMEGTKRANEIRQRRIEQSELQIQLTNRQTAAEQRLQATSDYERLRIEKLNEWREARKTAYEQERADEEARAEYLLELERRIEEGKAEIRQANSDRRNEIAEKETQLED